jgi:hypothetical protein
MAVNETVEPALLAGRALASAFFVIEGNGYAFNSKHGSIAVPAMVKWFEKHLTNTKQRD